MGPEKQARRGLQYTSTAITSPAIREQTTRQTRRQSHKEQQVHARHSTRASQRRHNLRGRRGAHNQGTQNGDYIHKAQRSGDTAYREKVDVPHRMAHMRCTSSTSTGKGNPPGLRRRIGAPELVFRTSRSVVGQNSQERSLRDGGRHTRIGAGNCLSKSDRSGRSDYTDVDRKSDCLILPTGILCVHRISYLDRVRVRIPIML